MKKVIVLTLVCAMLISNFTACGKKEKTVTLTIYSQLANFSGEQMGWSAKILKDKFNVVPTSSFFPSHFAAKELRNLIVATYANTAFAIQT